MKTAITNGLMGLALAIILFSTTSISVAQSIATDRDSYSPGATAVISGSGFSAEELVTLQVVPVESVEGETSEAHQPWTISADESGGFTTSWIVPLDETLSDPTMLASADGQASGAHAETAFKGNNNGTGVVTITADDGDCLGYTAANGNGPDNWEVIEGGNYTMTLTGVSECEGDVITVFVQNSNSGNWCFNAYGGNGTYVGSFTYPSVTCYTSPISYKCGADQPCDNSDTYNADGPSGNGSVHFRSSTFDANCNVTGEDQNCEDNPPCVCTSPPANITITPIGNDQIQVCWDAQECADGFIVQYQWKGHEDWNIIEVPGDQNCATIDLRGHVEVTVEVSTICEDGSITDKSSPVVYSYDGPCLTPSAMSTTNITATSATLNWTPGTTTHVQKIQLSRTGYPSVSIGVGDGVGSYTVTGLVPSSTYKWKVKGDCWSTAKKFTTAAQKTDGISTESPSVSLKVYPNPASNVLKADISMSDVSDQEVTIHLVNTLGQIMLSTNEVISGGHSIISLSLGSEVKDGIYTLQVISGDKTMSQRVIISND